MYQLKYLPAICGLIILIVIFEIFRNLTHIKFTLLDLMLSPICIICIYGLLRYEFFNNKYLLRYNQVEPVSRIRKLGIFIVSVLLMLTGLWCLLLGVREPLAFFSGIRGAVHGYTMAVMGILMLLIGAYGTLKSILIRFLKK
jgi:hypothetical protein